MTGTVRGKWVGSSWINYSRWLATVWSILEDKLWSVVLPRAEGAEEPRVATGKALAAKARGQILIIIFRFLDCGVCGGVRVGGGWEREERLKRRLVHGWVVVGGGGRERLLRRLSYLCCSLTG